MSMAGSTMTMGDTENIVKTKLINGTIATDH
ncbi:hypothetical protein L3N51_01435 [Metallosphaera sp. J1]|nr:hypothetical protein [Metallosphaera javensis (ex Hofmann et al. 2022)]